MKKLVLSVAFLLTASLLQAATPERRDAVFSIYNSTGLVTSTAAIVVDLSDTVNFAHKQTGAIDVAALRLDITKVAASSGTFKVGVITRVDATNGTVEWFWTKDFSRDVANTAISERLDLPDAFYRTRVVNGATPSLTTNSKTTNSTDFQTDVNLPTPIGNAAPGVGDIIAQLTNAGSGAIDFTLELLYDSER